MSEKSIEGWNIAAFVLYALLLPVAFMEYMVAALGFGMSTDSCYDAACDASYHEEAAIITVLIGIVVVLVCTLAIMVRGAVKNKIVIGWPFLGLLGLGIVALLGTAVLH